MGLFPKRMSLLKELQIILKESSKSTKLSVSDRLVQFMYYGLWGMAKILVGLTFWPIYSLFSIIHVRTDSFALDV